jgi:hypothetical protein
MTDKRQKSPHSQYLPKSGHFNAQLPGIIKLARSRLFFLNNRVQDHYPTDLLRKIVLKFVKCINV